MGSRFYWMLLRVTLYVICHHRTNINTELPSELKISNNEIWLCTNWEEEGHDQFQLLL